MNEFEFLSSNVVSQEIDAVLRWRIGPQALTFGKKKEANKILPVLLYLSNIMM